MKTHVAADIITNNSAVMKPNLYQHVFYTWLLANFIHPFTSIIYLSIMDGQRLAAELLGFEAMAFFCIYSLILSIPALLISMIGFRIIADSLITPLPAMIVWGLNILLSILAGISVVMLGFGGLYLPAFSVAIPGVTAGVLAILIRYVQFEKFLHSWRLKGTEPTQNQSALIKK